MKDFTEAEFLVLSAALRTIYQNICNNQQVNLQKLEEFADNLHQIVDRALEDPQGEHASAATEEPFEDVIALMWQIAWMLHQKGLDINSLHNLLERLRQLDGKLKKLYN